MKPWLDTGKFAKSESLKSLKYLNDLDNEQAKTVGIYFHELTKHLLIHILHLFFVVFR